MNIIYTPESIHDLQRLREFIAEKNPNAAAKTAQALKTGIKKLKSFPKLGTDVPEDESKRIRDLILGDYIVRYLYLEDLIYVLRVWHHKENWKET